MADQEKIEIPSFVNRFVELTEKLFEEKATTPMERKPKIEIKQIIEYDRKMRVSGLEIFNDPAYLAAVSFYRNENDLKNNRAFGAVVLYVDQKYIEPMYKSLGFKDVAIEEQEKCVEMTGEFFKMLIEGYKKDLAGKGFSDVHLSEIETYRNTSPFGVDFSYEQYHKFEIHFFWKDNETFVVDITMTKDLH